MAKCKSCQKKGFMVETDVNGLCSACAPYFDLALHSDLKALQSRIRAIERIDHAQTVLRNIRDAQDLLDRLQPYARAGLVALPMPPDRLADWLSRQQEHWRST